MAEVQLSLKCISYMEQIETAIADPNIAYPEWREEIVRQYWLDMEKKHGSRLNEISDPNGKRIKRPWYIRSDRW